MCKIVATGITAHLGRNVRCNREAFRKVHGLAVAEEPSTRRRRFIMRIGPRPDASLQNRSCLMAQRKSNLKRLWRYTRRNMQRGQKYMAQRRRATKLGADSTVFVTGCGRSGTTMLVDTLDCSPEIWLYNEFHRAAFDRLRLKSPEGVKRLIRRCAAPTVVFKPLSDVHRVDELLSTYENSRALWIYRRYQDTANSAVRLWGESQKSMARNIAAGNRAELGWLGERLSDEVVAQFREAYREEGPPEEGAALIWYYLNQFFFTTGIDQDPRVMLLQYEDLVQRPRENFAEIFGFLGCHFDESFLSDVHKSSIGKNTFPEISPRVHELCTSLGKRLDATYEARRTTPASG